MALKALNKAASANPAWFDIARDVLRRTDDGSVLLLHAMLEGLKDAYERGKAGLPPPPLKLVEPVANYKEPEHLDAVEAAPAAKRVTRRAAPAPAPAPVKRFSRSR